MPGQQDPDAIDRILEQWQRERPDLDLSGIGVLGRIDQLHLALSRVGNDVFGRHGLQQGEFDVLATLRRAVHPDPL